MPHTLCLPTRLLAVLFAVVAFVGCSQFADSHPEQPIDYSHNQHVIDNEIPCMYCHQTVDRSAVATVPSVETCMNCHEFIATDSEEIMKVADYWNRHEPIPWNKVHDQPDFVHFTHERHVKYFMSCFTETEPDDWAACKLADVESSPIDPHENMEFAAQAETCAQCHGPVWEMTTAERVVPFNMGWCVDCHREAIDRAPEEEKPLVQARIMDCYTCHK